MTYNKKRKHASKAYIEVSLSKIDLNILFYTIFIRYIYYHVHFTSSIASFEKRHLGMHGHFSYFCRQEFM